MRKRWRKITEKRLKSISFENLLKCKFSVLLPAEKSFYEIIQQEQNLFWILHIQSKYMQFEGFPYDENIFKRLNFFKWIYI